MKKIASILLCTVFMLSSIAYAYADSTTNKELGVVEIESGLVQGVDTDVDSVTLFKGVPYAAPPVGENRWREPQPVDSWEGVRVCDTWGNQAMQYDSNTEGSFWYDEFYYDEDFVPEMSEDCLYLNVYTPANSGNESYPVLVYIHGGGNDHGNASEMEFYASKLAEKGIIVVTVQYRVNIFGFLALDSLSAENDNGTSGNYAVLDLIESLKWVQKNISAFGGDPNQVTIDGQSAGAMNVNALLSTPLSKGLFNRAIIQSGFASSGFLRSEGSSKFTDLSSKEEKGKSAVEAAFGEGITLEDLRKIPAEDFIEYDTYQLLTAAGFSLNMDDYVFTEKSTDLMAKGALDGIDIIIGSNADEMTSLYSTGSMDVEQFYANYEYTYGTAFEESYGVNLYNKHNFPSIYDAENSETQAYNLMLKISSDGLLEYNRLCAEYAMANNKNCNVYVYYFNHVPPGRNSEFYGSYHSAELWYMFNSMRDLEGQRDWTDADYQMAEIMSSYWANFVKSGNPNGDTLAKWSTTNSNSLTFMRFYEGKAEMSNTQYNGSLDGRTPLHREYNMLTYNLSESDITMPQGGVQSSTNTGSGTGSSSQASVPPTGDTPIITMLVLILVVVSSLVIITKRKRIK